MTDPLLAEIAAHPALDDARLVWADREGGERGELVVVQCALARGEGDRPLRRRLYARERELLERAAKWPETAGLEEPRFERGFIAHATVKIDDIPKLLARHPLLASLELADARLDVRADDAPPWTDTARRLARVFDDLPPGRVARIKAEPLTWVDSMVPRLEDHLEEFLGALGSTHAGRALRGLELLGKFPREAFHWLTHWTELEELRVVCDSWGLVSVSFFAETHPRLHRLALQRQLGGFTALPTIASFTELALARGFDDAALLGIASTPMPKLRRLALPSNVATAIGYRHLGDTEGLPQLEALDISSAQHLDDATIALLARSKLAPNLRVLELRDSSKLTALAIPHLLSFPKLDRLDLRSSYGDTRDLAPVKDVIPSVAL